MSWLVDVAPQSLKSQSSVAVLVPHVTWLQVSTPHPCLERFQANPPDTNTQPVHLACIRCQLALKGSTVVFPYAVTVAWKSALAPRLISPSQICSATEGWVGSGMSRLRLAEQGVEHSSTSSSANRCGVSGRGMHACEQTCLGMHCAKPAQASTGTCAEW